jgi:small subunit ribosomal protein S6|tara:strand:+ start:20131 stop:20442 length:312 start_codon:yes stop_codon:yes gene_type:complete
MSKTKVLNTPIRFYETMLLARPDLNDNNLLSLIQKHEQIILNAGGREIFSYNQGHRHLTFKIKDFQDGIFINFNFAGNGQIVKKLEQELNIDEQVLRFLTTKV